MIGQRTGRCSSRGRTGRLLAPRRADPEAGEWPSAKPMPARSIRRPCLRASCAGSEAGAWARNSLVPADHAQSNAPGDAALRHGIDEWRGASPDCTTTPALATPTRKQLGHVFTRSRAGVVAVSRRARQPPLLGVRRRLDVFLCLRLDNGDLQPVKQAKTWEATGRTAAVQRNCSRERDVRQRQRHGLTAPCPPTRLWSLICQFPARGRIGCAVQATADAIGRRFVSCRDELRGNGGGARCS